VGQTRRRVITRIYALSCGTLEFDRKLFFPDSAPGARLATPVSSYLVVHPRGRVLFDTGMHCNLPADPVGCLGERMAKLFNVRSRAGEDVIGQLALLGLRPDDITHVVNSHFHFDHCGCNAFFPRATFLVQRAEMAAARAPASNYSSRDWDHALQYRLLDGEHDVFGDGVVVLMPTPGHTAGHQSLRVRAGPGMEFVFAADACYTREHMDREVLPVAVWNAGEMTRSVALLRNLRERKGLTLLYGHDPGQWAEIPHAPAPLA
jgi:glyoxylase-like metal-dependent hydrolase (beta-lactamase superfamily II)